MKDAKGHGSDPQGMHSQGVQQIGNSKIVSIRSIHPEKWRIDAITNNSSPNARANSAMIDKIRAAIKSGEEIAPIIVSSNGTVIDGHHRYVAYKAEKVTRVPVVIQGTK